MKILITGASGMLGNALCDELSNKYKIIGLDIIKSTFFVQCDITNQAQISAKINNEKPDIVIHAAAYTDVDGCERDSEKTNAVNVLGTQNVAQACKDCQCLLIYISTDFVFDGERSSAYIEEDLPNPINIYGKSKLDGEKTVRSILKEFIIVRSSWLFGRGGRNFVDSILKKAQDKEDIKVVDDQFGSPTYSKDLAQAIGKLISLKPRNKAVFHITNSDSCSWYEFAQVVKETAGLDADIVPISSEQYHSPAKRPKMSILDNRCYQEYAGEKLRHWKEALKEYLSG